MPSAYTQHRLLHWQTLLPYVFDGLPEPNNGIVEQCAILDNLIDVYHRHEPAKKDSDDDEPKVDVIYL